MAPAMALVVPVPSPDRRGAPGPGPGRRLEVAGGSLARDCGSSGDAERVPAACRAADAEPEAAVAVTAGSMGEREKGGKN
jgi:hypothetical protein